MPLRAGSVSAMDVYEAMGCAPTSRRFTDEPVAPEALRRALDGARFAPSGGNRQGWRVVVVRDPDRRRAIRDLYLPHWREYMELTGGAAMLADPSGFDPGRVRIVRGADEYARHMDEVPVHVLVGVCLADVLATDSKLPRQSIVGGASIYPFVQNLLLALRDEQLGAALSTLLVPAEAEVKRLLRMPEDVALAAHVGVGHRADPWPGRLSRKPLEEFAFAERYGEPLA
jgi:nitroreductase